MVDNIIHEYYHPQTTEEAYNLATEEWGRHYGEWRAEDLIGPWSRQILSRNSRSERWAIAEWVLTTLMRGNTSYSDVHDTFLGVYEALIPIIQANYVAEDLLERAHEQAGAPLPAVDLTRWDGWKPEDPRRVLHMVREYARVIAHENELNLKAPENSELRILLG
jgi:hypothetical protein